MKKLWIILIILQIADFLGAIALAVISILTEKTIYNILFWATIVLFLVIFHISRKVYFKIPDKHKIKI